MNEKDIKILKELAVKKLKNGFTKAEALRSLQQAGILNKKGNFTRPYQNLARIVLKP